jgi:hypothetical protein
MNRISESCTIARGDISSARTMPVFCYKAAIYVPCQVRIFGTKNFVWIMPALCKLPVPSISRNRLESEASMIRKQMAWLLSPAPISSERRIPHRSRNIPRDVE